MKGCVAVFDVGKTNVKLIVFDRDGKVVAERSQRHAPLPPDARWPYLRLDTERAWAFLSPSLKDVGAAMPIEAVSVAAHGAAGALVTEDGVAAPPVDYEFDGFAAVDADYDALRPPFDETFSPHLARGLNLGRQIFFLERTCPADFARARAFLAYPQFWSWRLSGVAASEVTSLAAHADLWRPKEGRLSSLVERAGWGAAVPAAAQGLGHARSASVPRSPRRPDLPADVRVICGAHDSNASLVPYLAARSDPFTVVSTGTWVIIMAVGGTGTLDPNADMIANVDVLGRPVPTARLMGGREFAVLAGRTAGRGGRSRRRGGRRLGRHGDARLHRPGRPVRRPQGLDRGCAAATPAAPGRARDPLFGADDRPYAPVGSRRRATSSSRAASTGRRPFPPCSPRSCPGRNVFVAPASGAAEGAAMLARWGEPHDPPKLAAAEAWRIPEIEAYRERWERSL